MKITFTKIDNGYMCKPDYQCSNGLLIESASGFFDCYKYYVGEKGFNYLKEAKEFCKNFKEE